MKDKRARDIVLGDAAAWALLEPVRWPEGVTCLRCDNRRISRVRTTGKSGKARRLYECSACGYQFTITTGTIFHNSHLPLGKWFQIIAWSAGGVRPSVNELSRRLHVHYRTAKHALRQVCAALDGGDSATLVAGILDRLPHSSAFPARRSIVPAAAATRRPPADAPHQIAPAAGTAAWEEEKSAFRPDWSLRANAAGRAHLIGFVVPDLLHQFFAQIATGILKRIRTYGYNLLICSCAESADCERQEIEDLLDGRVEALVVAPTQTTLQAFQRIEQSGIPFVLVDREISGMQANYVGVDDEEVGRIAVAHLVECGCRRIAHIGGPDISTSIRRLNGYRAALESRCLPNRPEYIVRAASGDDLAERSGYEAMCALLELDPRPDGIFCFNDSLAVGAISAASLARLRVPRDVAIIGVGNVPYASLLRVPLTSIDQRSSLIGEHAAQMVLRLLGAEAGAPGRRILLRPSLVVRHSTTGFHGLENLSRWSSLAEVPDAM